MKKLHRHAMNLVKKADSFFEAKSINKALCLYAAACNIEKYVAYSLDKNQSSEPARSILFLSAASLAWRSKKYETAERLIFEGLSGFPLRQTKLDLLRLHDDVNSKIDFSNAVLNDNVIVATFKGEDIPYGMIPVGKINTFMNNFSSIFFRTRDRLLEKAYSTIKHAKSKSRQFESYVLAPEAGSFKFKMQFKSSDPRLPLLPDNQITQSKILDEILFNVSLFNDEKFEELKKEIKYPAYYTHFINTIKQIAPDGEKIRSISLTSKNKNVVFVKTLEEIKCLDIEYDSSNDGEASYGVEDITGLLSAASIKENEVRLQVRNRKPQIIKLSVKEGLDEIVRTYFGYNVIAKISFTDPRKTKGVLLSVTEPE